MRVDADLDGLVNHLCVDPTTARYGPYKLPPGDEQPRGVDLIPGRLRRYRLVDRNDKAVDLHAYVGLAGVGGELWEQEVRLLQRLGASGLDSLPEIFFGSYEEAAATKAAGFPVGGLALVATTGSDRTLADDGAAAWIREQPSLALTQFQRLAEALAELHDLGAMHRGLTPYAVLADTSQRHPRLWLARFEMSALIGNLLRRSVDSVAEREELSRLFLAGGETDYRVLACQPFERLEFLLPGDGEPTPLHEAPTSDVFSLAAVVWEWFCDPAPLIAEPLPDDLRERHRELHRRMLVGLAGDAVPRGLSDLLHDMLAEKAKDRPLPWEVAQRLVGGGDDLMWHLLDEQSTRPYLVIDSPKDTTTKLSGWDMLAHSADTAEGIDALAAWMAEEFADTRVMHSPEGAVRFVRTGDINDRKKARIVLVGRRVLWFCRPYQRKVWGRMGPELEHALIIKYVAQRESPGSRRSFEQLKRVSKQMQVPGIEVVGLDVADSVMDAALIGRPSWNPILDRVVGVDEAENPHQAYGEALDWLLAYQGAELQARSYAFVRHDDGHHRTVIEWDPERERRYINSDALLTKFADSPWLRPRMGEFFVNLEDDEGGNHVEIFRDRGGRPENRPVRAQWSVVPEKEGPDRVVLQRVEGVDQLPERGWIRPKDDHGSRIALSRQATARGHLMQTRGLLGQLRDPRSGRLPQSRWADAGAGLKGEDNRAVVREMLTNRPFFAIQGPPGTGKTTVVSEAVAAYLAAESTARVLVSAQSGHALDNLAQRILHRMGELTDDGTPTDRVDITALRITSRSGTLPHEYVRPWTRDALAERAANRIAERVDGALSGAQPALRKPLRRWRELLDYRHGEHVLPELGDRLERSANLVFSTCVMATPETVTPGGARSRFDWVIVEEAAKAWPTELAMPLTRGTAWTLIGDHKQLGAHRRSDFERFLDSCAGDPSPELASLAEQRDEHLQAFDTLRGLFDRLDVDGLTERERTQLPLRQLTTQFRMREPIAEVVSRVFYKTGAAAEPGELPRGLLRTGREVPVAPVRRPDQLAGVSLVWLDTNEVADCSCDPHWSNQGEARLVAELVERLEPSPAPLRNGYSAEPLVVLTPYRAQVRLLEQYDVLRNRVSTIHAFQGREADIVIISLVRDRRLGSPSVAWTSLGHLGQPNLINVMMSRARRLLVLVGNYKLFQSIDDLTVPAVATSGSRPEDADKRFWGDLCTAVGRYGLVLPAGEVVDR